MRYIISAKPDRLFWKLSCVAIEKQRALWRERECPMEKIATHAQGSTVDALLLMHVNSTLNSTLKLNVSLGISYYKN